MHAAQCRNKARYRFTVFLAEKAFLDADYFKFCCSGNGKDVLFCMAVAAGVHQFERRLFAFFNGENQMAAGAQQRL